MLTIASSYTLQEVCTISDMKMCFQDDTHFVCKHGVGTDRNGLLAAGPDLAGYQFTIRLAGFCRTKRPKPVFEG